MSEIVVHRTDGEGLPVRARRGIVEPIDARVTRLLGLALAADAGPVSQIGFAAQLGAMAAASKAALASDLACYLRWCEDIRVAPLPAEPEDLVRYITMLETRGAKPATVARRVACRRGGLRPPATSWSVRRSRACAGVVALPSARRPRCASAPRSIRTPRGSR